MSEGQALNMHWAHKCMYAWGLLAHRSFGVSMPKQLRLVVTLDHTVILTGSVRAMSVPRATWMQGTPTSMNSAQTTGRAADAAATSRLSCITAKCTLSMSARATPCRGADVRPSLPWEHSSIDV